jgi:hypothetical protein
MKTRFLSLLLAAIVCLTAVTTSCIYDPQSGEVVVTEKICVTLQSYEEDGSIGKRAVCDKFRERLIEEVESYGATLDDIDDISMVSATYKLASLKNTDHDWLFSGDVYVSRADVADGPELLISFSDESVDGLKGKPASANLNSAGVELINRALDDLLGGGDPQVKIELVDESFSPEPSESDPLQAVWLACVEFQAVVNVSSE